MNIKSQLGSLLCESLSAAAPTIRGAIIHHLSQHLDVIAPKSGVVSVYHLSIDGVNDRSNGRAIFMGPMKSGTTEEKDALAAVLLGMPNIREKLNRDAGALVAVTAQGQGEKYAAVIELTETDLETLQQK